ncbi:arginine N-succinyltransferase [Aestuariirhabdus sp. Z084]|uniref:arginine N-succinyltransferase n=1 Tax=Aestuariirhabdus haliotis TaxID=2918751 RepID=UPI00201B3B82|nr:arginine N-succinyltransferase [Aestuariirhabdus haliotis]MCL6414493.1 arginine N-succinyltransferase [Aestuariirhabdus haliotis]MCL6418525.1 arginine N-succinyltransferase [Aestuariirhabdus haliotis]
MLIIRPIDYHDLPALERLAVVSGGSLTTLPAHREYLNDLIGNTQQSLRTSSNVGDNLSFHFVLEDSARNELLGISGIECRIGMNSPFYSYRMSTVSHSSHELNVQNQVGTLTICQDLAGSTRLCTLFLAPEHQNSQNHQLLSRARLLFMALHRSLFSDRCIAELQGQVNAEGQSPFWESLGRHFFSMPLSRATFLAGINFKGFIASLMPQQPIYIPLLAEAAQNALGAPRNDIKSNKVLLEMEGFRFKDHIDIFDGGPTLEVDTDQLETLHQVDRTTFIVSGNDSSQVTSASTGNGSDDVIKPYLVSNCNFDQFRCLVTELPEKQPILSLEQMKVLMIDEGEAVQITPCHSLSSDNNDQTFS